MRGERVTSYSAQLSKLQIQLEERTRRTIAVHSRHRFTHTPGRGEIEMLEVKWTTFG